MKKAYFLILIILMFAFIPSYGQVDIQQIETSTLEQGPLIQTINSGMANVAEITQLGDQNRTSIAQSKNNALIDANLATSYQKGDWNSSSIAQVGSGNALLSYQLSYMTSSLYSSDKISTGAIESFLSVLESDGSLLKSDNGNSLNSHQEGSNNQLLSLQTGTNNQITTKQTGQYNYLGIIQQGTNNQVADYIQVNNTGNVLYDKVFQSGDNLQLNVPDDSSGRIYGNTYSQQGSNLSLTVSSSLLNSLGGFNVQQTGHDMHIVIDQSYFPTK